MLFVRVTGVPLPVALRGADREAAIASIMRQVQTVHTIGLAGIRERDPLVYARGVWDAQRQALAIGYGFLSGVSDVTALASTRSDAPTLADCGAAARWICRLWKAAAGMGSPCCAQPSADEET